jgi:hypothetical protein
MLSQQEVEKEIRRGKDLHGPLTQDKALASLVLACEVLEALKEAYTCRKQPRHSPEYAAARLRLRTELVQVVAVVTQWVTNIDKELQ